MFRRPGRGRLLLLVFLAMSVVLITLDFRQGEGGPLDTARDVVGSVVAPIQRGFTTVFRPIGDFFSSGMGGGNLRCGARSGHRVHDDHIARGVMGNLVRHAPDQEPCRGGHSLRAHDDHIERRTHVGFQEQGLRSPGSEVKRAKCFT